MYQFRDARSNSLLTFICKPADVPPSASQTSGVAPLKTNPSARRKWRKTELTSFKGADGGKKETITQRTALVSPNASLSEHSNILRSPQVEGSIRLRVHGFNYAGHKIILKWVQKKIKNPLPFSGSRFRVLTQQKFPAGEIPLLEVKWGEERVGLSPCLPKLSFSFKYHHHMHWPPKDVILGLKLRANVII